MPIPSNPNDAINELIEFNRSRGVSLTLEQATDMYLNHVVAQQQRASRVGPASASQVLMEENRPFSRGLEAMSGEFSRGLGDVTEPGVLPKIMGPLRMLNAPSVGAGAVAGTTVQNVLSQIPGLGGPSGVVPAGGAALADALAQVFTGKALMKPVVGIAKGITRSLAGLSQPGALREAGVEAAARRMGRKPESLTRALTPSKSSQMFEEVKAANPDIPTKGVVDAVMEAHAIEAGRSTPMKEVVGRLERLFDKFAGSNKAQYNDVLDEIQQLKLRARGLMDKQPATATSLNDAASKMTDVLDRVHPSIRAANREHLRGILEQDMIDALRTSSPSRHVRKLIETDKSVAKVFDKKTLRDVLHIADRINNVAADAPIAGGRIINAVAGPFGSMLIDETGRAFLRLLLKPQNKVTAQTLVSTAILWRQYQQATGQE